MIAVQEFSLQVLIVGAGLGGLSAALACRLAGHEVTVLESAKVLSEVGAGLQLTPNGVKMLRRWGLGPELDRLSAHPETISVLRYSDGKVLAHEDNFQENCHRKYNESYLNTHRADLQKIMYDRCVDLGVDFHLGQRVNSVGQESPVQVTTEAGNTFSADLVVGADGLWSRCRETMLGKSDKPLPTGDLAYRIVLTLDQLEDPELRGLVSTPGVRFWVGPHAHVVAYSLKAGSMYNIVLLCPDDLPEGSSRQHDASIEEMRHFFAGWDPLLRRFLDQVHTVDKWKLMHRAALDSWTNESRNFVLLGDACHPMLPYLAQGANSSLEDGAVLGRLLGFVRSKDQLARAVDLYETIRKKRGEAIVRETFRQREAFHMPDGPAQEERDRLFETWLGKEIEGRFPSRWTCPVVQPWMYGYDAYQEADDAAQGAFD